MSSNMRIEAVCENCGCGFIAKTTKTKNCSDNCAKQAYKKRKRAEKINNSISKTVEVKTISMEIIKKKEYLTVAEVSQLLSMSKRTTYRLIADGKIKSTNLSERQTRVKRSDIDELFN